MTDEFLALHSHFAIASPSRKLMIAILSLDKPDLVATFKEIYRDYPNQRTQSDHLAHWEQSVSALQAQLKERFGAKLTKKQVQEKLRQHYAERAAYYYLKNFKSGLRRWAMRQLETAQTAVDREVQKGLGLKQWSRNEVIKGIRAVDPMSAVLHSAGLDGRGRKKHSKNADKVKFTYQKLKQTIQNLYNLEDIPRQIDVAKAMGYIGDEAGRSLRRDISLHRDVLVSNGHSSCKWKQLASELTEGM